MCLQVSALAREAKELQGKTSQKKDEVKEEKKTSSTEGEPIQIQSYVNLKTTNHSLIKFNIDVKDFPLNEKKTENKIWERMRS